MGRILQHCKWIGFILFIHSFLWCFIIDLIRFNNHQLIQIFEQING